MNKSVYSLVLMDDVVAEVDRLAYENNTSRSNMVNQILAEYVSYTTPEKRMREIFETVERMAAGGNTFQVLLQPSDSMFSLRSALSYKYNPTVRYSVELNRRERPTLGELRVSVRSQNSAFRLYMLQFFKLWAKLEQTYAGRVEFTAEPERFTRKLVLAEGASPDSGTLGQAIADYIRLFDTSLKLFFNNLDQPQAAIARMEALYAAYLRTDPVIL